jgi:hypothetical protein
LINKITISTWLAYTEMETSRTLNVGAVLPVRYLGPVLKQQNVLPVMNRAI